MSVTSLASNDPSPAHFTFSSRVWHATIMSYNFTHSMANFPRPRSLYTVFYLLAVLSAVGILTSSLRTLWTTNYGLTPNTTVESRVQHLLHDVDPFDPSNFLRGPPTEKFRDNLRSDSRYISAWISAGWTNDVMTYINLIYLGILTDRIPIVGMFIPTHIGRNLASVDFGEVFDMVRLRKELRRPVLEWHEVKNRSSEVLEPIGCWNIWESSQFDDSFPRHSYVPENLGLDISYTTAPTWIKVIPGFRHDRHVYSSALATLGFPETRKENLVEPKESPIYQLKLPPDEHLLCYDFLFYVCSHQPNEYDYDYSPAWLLVGQHLYWTERLRSLGDEYVRRTIGIVDAQIETPSYIGIHIRHGDFASWCGSVPVDDCFAPISVISRRVEEVRKEIQVKKGILVEHVIVTSDEKDVMWWKQVVEKGWLMVDHSQTVKLHGPWYPVFIDAVIQSGGLGFVGTDRSTMSTLARRRVQSWRDGVARTLKWGKPDSDDH